MGTCADYVSKAYCTADGGYGSGWDDSSTIDDYAVNGVAATLACCGCGGGSTVTGKQACQGHSYDKATCEAVGCCRWNVLLGCRANDGDALCYSGNPCDTTVSPGPSPPGPGKKAVIGGVIAGAAALAVAGGIMAKSTTTAGPGPVTTTSVTQGAQTNPPPTTTTKNSSSDLLWLAVALWRRTGSLHGWQEKEKEVEEGDARQPALSRACIAARRRGTAGVVAYGTPADGALSDYAGGCTDDGGDGSDGANCDAHNGRDCRSDDAAHNAGECCPDDAGICAHSNFGYASDAFGRARSLSDAGDRWVWNASVASNGWRRLRNASAARNPQ